MSSPVARVPTSPGPSSPTPLGPSSDTARAYRAAGSELTRGLGLPCHQGRPHLLLGPPAPSPAELACARAELAIKIELKQLIVSILDDPSVSRVMREASFSSTDEGHGAGGVCSIVTNGGDHGDV